MTDQHLGSMKALQAQLSQILDAVNAEPARAVAALANPVLAAEEAGYSFAPDVIEEIDDRARFSTQDIASRRRLRKQIRGHLGEDLDLTSETELAVRLDRLGVGEGYDLAKLVRRPRFRRGSGDIQDPLAALEGRHDVIAPLLTYRALDARRPSLATAEVYAAIRDGSLRLPVTAVRLRPKAGSGDDPT